MQLSSWFALWFIIWKPSTSTKPTSTLIPRSGLSGKFRHCTSLVISHRTSFAALLSVSRVHLAHTNHCNVLRQRNRRMKMLSFRHFQDQFLTINGETWEKKTLAFVSQSLFFFCFSSRSLRTIRLRITVSESHIALCDSSHYRVCVGSLVNDRFKLKGCFTGDFNGSCHWPRKRVYEGHQHNGRKS